MQLLDCLLLPRLTLLSMLHLLLHDRLRQTARMSQHLLQQWSVSTCSQAVCPCSVNLRRWPDASAQLARQQYMKRFPKYNSWKGQS